MSHRRRRISRVLLAVLAVTVGIGVFTWVRRSGPDDAVASGTVETVATVQPGATATAPTPAPQSQPAVAALPTLTGGAVLEQTRQTLPQQPQQQNTGPFRTETPGAMVTQTPTGTPAGAGTATPVPLAKAAPQPGGIGPIPGAGAPMAAVAKPNSPAADPSKVSIKPYQPPAGAGSNTATGGAVITQGRSLMQSGKLLEARDAVNAALVSGRLSGYDADAARALLSEINQTVVFSTRKFADDRFGGTYKVESGDRFDKIGRNHGITADLLMQINGITDPKRLRSGAYIKVLKGPFHAVVSKGGFRLDLYLGGLPGTGADVAYVTSFPVGLGKDDSTPLGKWQVEPDRKVKNPVYYSPRGEGVIEADDPANPLGEFWVGLVGVEGDAVGKESYGIHGTIDPQSIGKMESMGCIRLRNEDVAVVFNALVEAKSTVKVVE